MEILITGATGSGPTLVAAFDKALKFAGISDFNLIPLSSVIPKNAKISKKIPVENKKKIGHRLYVVLSKTYALKKGEITWAGLGWAQRKDGSGIFVELTASSEKKLRNKIDESLESMMSYRDGDFVSKGVKIMSAECADGKPNCAIVCAIYGSERW